MVDFLNKKMGAGVNPAPSSSLPYIRSESQI